MLLSRILQSTLTRGRLALIDSRGHAHRIGPGGTPEVAAHLRDPPGDTNAWTRKYIFPGGYCPALSEVLAAVERSGLWVTDVEILRLHYAETLRHWFERFQAQRERAKTLYDERFCQMWEFYLAGAEMEFCHGRLMVFQIQLAHRRDAVPITRDYLYAQPAAPAGSSALRAAQGIDP